MRGEFAAIVEDGGDGISWAHSPDVPGAHGQGLTDEEALDDLKAAITLLLECRRDEARARMTPGAREVSLSVG